MKFVIDCNVLKKCKTDDINIVIPNSVTSIEDNVFRDCKNL